MPKTAFIKLCSQKVFSSYSLNLQMEKSYLTSKVNTNSSSDAPLCIAHEVVDIVVVAADTEAHTGTEENSEVEVAVVDELVTEKQRHIDEMLSHLEALLDFILEVLEVGAAERIHDSGFKVELAACADKEACFAARQHIALFDIVAEINADLDTAGEGRTIVTGGFLRMQRERHHQRQNGQNREDSFHNDILYNKLQIMILGGKDTTFFTHGNRKK